jgi:hypothetical protein
MVRGCNDSVKNSSRGKDVLQLSVALRRRMVVEEVEIGEAGAGYEKSRWPRETPVLWAIRHAH